MRAAAAARVRAVRAAAPSAARLPQHRARRSCHGAAPPHSAGRGNRRDRRASRPAARCSAAPAVASEGRARRETSRPARARQNPRGRVRCSPAARGTPPQGQAPPRCPATARRAVRG